MKTTIGVMYTPFGPDGIEPPDPRRLQSAARAAERSGFDGIWMPDHATGRAGDPLTNLAYLAAVTQHLTLGTAVLVLPGRSPALLAKRLASLDRLSGGRLALTVGLGHADPAEHQAFGVERRGRAALFEEVVPLLRRLWAETSVHHHGPAYRYQGLDVQPKPLRGGLDLWMGGTSDTELRRAGRLADGWLSALATPRTAERARGIIERAAAEAGRAVNDVAYGTLVPYRLRPGRLAPARERMLRSLHTTQHPAPLGADSGIDALVPTLKQLPAHLARLADVGLCTFVLVPADRPEDWATELAEVAAAVLPRRAPRSVPED